MSLPDHTHLSERKTLISFSFLLANPCTLLTLAVNVTSTLRVSLNFSLKQLTTFFVPTPLIYLTEGQKSTVAHKFAPFHFSSVFHCIFFQKYSVLSDSHAAHVTEVKGITSNLLCCSKCTHPKDALPLCVIKPDVRPHVCI